MPFQLDCHSVLLPLVIAKIVQATETLVSLAVTTADGAVKLWLRMRFHVACNVGTPAEGCDTSMMTTPMAVSVVISIDVGIGVGISVSSNDCWGYSVDYRSRGDVRGSCGEIVRSRSVDCAADRN